MRETIVRILRTVGTEPDADLEGLDLVGSGVLDSLGFIELVNALEDAYGIEIQPTQIDPDAWRSVESIEALVARLVEAQAG